MQLSEKSEFAVWWLNRMAPLSWGSAPPGGSTNGGHTHCLLTEEPKGLEAGGSLGAVHSSGSQVGSKQTASGQTAGEGGRASAAAGEPDGQDEGLKSSSACVCKAEFSCINASFHWCDLLGSESEVNIVKTHN